MRDGRLSTRRSVIVQLYRLIDLRHYYWLATAVSKRSCVVTSERECEWMWAVKWSPSHCKVTIILTSWHNWGCIILLLKVKVSSSHTARVHVIISTFIWSIFAIHLISYCPWIPAFCVRVPGPRKSNSLEAKFCYYLNPMKSLCNLARPSLAASEEDPQPATS